jgi:dihydrofolate synthase/folylpolyglutamate synthase
LASPQDGYPIVHIAGTNGKTSTARMVAALIHAHGLVPGLFTSPHLQHVEERYEYGLAAMTAPEFAAAMAELAPIADLYEERSGAGVTYFELTAAMAFMWFADRSVDAAVIETGLGGRLDATNAAQSEVAVVTTIGLEHTEYLGDTIELIAAEKLAILDAGGVLVTGDLPPEAVSVAQGVVQDRGASWLQWGTDFEPEDPREWERGWVFDLRTPMGAYEALGLSLHGRHQVDNFAVAVAAAEALFGRALDEAGVREAAASVSAPGRMEVVQHDPPVMLDGAHNPQAMSALAAALRNEYPGTQWDLVFGVMGDKDIPAMLEHLDGLVGRVFVASADSPRAASADSVAGVVEETLGVTVEVHESVGDATAAAMAAGAAVLVTGSIYVVGEARDVVIR